jgi:hypothetical protein
VLKENIKTLVCEDVQMRARNLESLINKEMLQNVMYLKLPRNNLGNAGVAILFSSDRLKHIRKLDLSSNNITDEGAIKIEKSPNFPYLRTLDLRVNKLGDAGLKSIV